MLVNLCENAVFLNLELETVLIDKATELLVFPCEECRMGAEEGRSSAEIAGERGIDER